MRMSRLRVRSCDVRSARCSVRFTLAGRGLSTHARTRCELDGLCNREQPARLHSVRREMIPPSQLFNRHTEAIGDGNECVTMTHGVVLRIASVRNGSDRDNQLVSFFDSLASRYAVGLGDIARTNVLRRCNRVKRLSSARDVKAPAGAFLFGDVLDAFRENIGSTDGKMKIEGYVARRGHAKQTWVQRDDLLQ